MTPAIIYTAEQVKALKATTTVDGFTHLEKMFALQKLEQTKISEQNYDLLCRYLPTG
jgi:hypothetical protein